MNYEFSLTLVNLDIMSLERVSENKKKCEIGTLKYGLLRIRKSLDLGRDCTERKPHEHNYPLAILATFFAILKIQVSKETRTTPSVSLIPQNWFSNRLLHAIVIYRMAHWTMTVAGARCCLTSGASCRLVQLDLAWSHTLQATDCTRFHAACARWQRLMHIGPRAKSKQQHGRRGNRRCRLGGWVKGGWSDRFRTKST